MPPLRAVMCFKGYIVNGFRFHTKDRERQRKTQNSGVFLTAEISSFASERDSSPMTGNVGYYGILNDVMELQYIGGNQIVLFKCDWWDVMNRGGKGIKQDEYGFTCVNFTRTLNTNEPFILSNQAQEDFYVQDTIDSNWHVTIKIQTRDLYDMESEVDSCQQIELDLHITDMVDTNDGVITWNRPDIEGVVLDANIVLPHQTQEHEVDDTFIDDGEGDDTSTDDGDGDDISIDDGDD
ncbi:hypothetical protein MRB53_028404 [Persea americana]|uniref:Uncharacterized protein n=1 Tax=Persea americana TaxID=3435 RepID=A0ACC2KFF1_PERAE|nr:hypothetical protein MRB53_028404 [Persea americana]